MIFGSREVKWSISQIADQIIVVVADQTMQQKQVNKPPNPQNEKTECPDKCEKQNAGQNKRLSIIAPDFVAPA